MLQLCERDVDLLGLCIAYSRKPFGASGHHSMQLIQRLYDQLPKESRMVNNCSACKQDHQIEFMKLSLTDDPLVREVGMCMTAGIPVYVIEQSE